LCGIWVDVMIDVKENEDGSFDISWDKDDIHESVLNTWTESDFIQVIVDRLNDLKE